jgi:hypothetical protein
MLPSSTAEDSQSSKPKTKEEGQVDQLASDDKMEFVKGNLQETVGGKSGKRK